MSDKNGNSLANQVVINFWRDIIRTRERKMLKNTFLHISGLGIKTEQRIWSSGIHSWDDLLREGLRRASPRRRDILKQGMEESIEQLSAKNPKYFGEQLPSNQHWRFFPEFRESAVYLDIETTGLDSWGNKITTIALYDGKSIFTYVQGQNLDEFKEDIQRYKVLVTTTGNALMSYSSRAILGLN